MPTDVVAPIGTPPGPVADRDVAVRIRGLVKTYRTGLRGRPFRAIDGIDVDVATGSIHAILGPNGAGKTTTVNVVATALAPDEGEVTVLGHDVRREQRDIRRQLGSSGQYSAVDPNLTPVENLRLMSRLHGLGRSATRDRAAVLVDEFALGPVADRPCRTLSGGTRRRVDLAAALVGDPALVLLDEPTTGLDPRGRQAMWTTIRSLVERGTTILLTTQYLEEADTLADRITVIDHGRVVADGGAGDLKARIGGARLILTLADGTSVDDVRRHVQDLTVERLDEGGDCVVVVPDGTRGATVALSTLIRGGVDIVDSVVREPTLDDVFLRLTEGTRP